MKRNEEIYAAYRNLHDLIAAEAEGGNANIGALVMYGEYDPTDSCLGQSSAFSGGHTVPIVVGLVGEMRCNPKLYEVVSRALAIVDDEKAKQN